MNKPSRQVGKREPGTTAPLRWRKKNMSLLQVENMSVQVEEKQILRQINLNIGQGETHVLMGPNGAGKSTLGYTLMGNPR